MENQTTAEKRKRVRQDEVIAKIKDDGDFDKLRLKIIRRLKDNDELRSSIITAVKQSAALKRSGAEKMKPRQLSDAIYEEVGSKVMGQVSDAVWQIIRSRDGMKCEIEETVLSVYNTFVNPEGSTMGQPSSSGAMAVEKEADNNFPVKSSEGKVDDSLSDQELKGPPGFSMLHGHDKTNNETQQQERQQLAMPNDGEPNKEKRELDHTEDVLELPGFSRDAENKQLCDDSDEDPIVPPGFG